MTDTKRIKVLVLLPNLVSGGGQRAVIDLFKSLNRKIFAPKLLVQEKLGSFLDEVERDCDPDEVAFLMERPYQRSDIPKLFWQTVRHAASADIVLGGLEGRAAYCGLFAAKLLRKPFLGWIHIDWRPFQEQVSWRQTVSLRAYRFADQLVACSAGAADSFSELFNIRRDRILPILNMIPCDSILANIEEPLPAEYEALFKKPTILMVGRLEEQKGYPYLFEAHSRLIANGFSHNLIIIGEGNLFNELQHKVRSLGIENTVHFLGFQKNPHRFMKRATVFTLSSNFEGFGLVIAEALLCGAPVVATDCPSGPAEILEDGKYGLLVPPKEPAALADALNNMLVKHNMRQEFAALGPSRGLDFDRKRVLPRWEQLLIDMAVKQVVKPKAGPTTSTPTKLPV